MPNPRRILGPPLKRQIFCGYTVNRPILTLDNTSQGGFRGEKRFPGESGTVSDLPDIKREYFPVKF